MGAALVIPTKDVKMLIPSTAASLQRAFRKPKAVVLLGRRGVGPCGAEARRICGGQVSGWEK